MNQHGFMKTVFILLLFFLGVLLYFIWQESVRDVPKASIKFDSGLSEVLLKNGMDDRNILSQSRQERSTFFLEWIEYYKEVEMPAGVNRDVLVSDIVMLARQCSMQVYQKQVTVSGITLKMGRLGKTFSWIVFKPAITRPEKKAKAAIVIDDLGYIRDISAFYEAGVKLNYAILPHEPYSERLAKELAGKGIPFLLHLPLEPEGYPEKKPGDYALLVSMSDREIIDSFLDNLKTVPGASGVSSHMGSLFSSDAKKMTVLLKEIKKNNMFYFDSYTSKKSEAKTIAGRIGLRCLENRVFLDFEDTEDFVAKQLDALLAKSVRNGSCIAIGHVQKKALLPVLKKYLPKFEEAGVEFVYLSELHNTDK